MQHALTCCGHPPVTRNYIALYRCAVAQCRCAAACVYQHRFTYATGGCFVCACVPAQDYCLRTTRCKHNHTFIQQTQLHNFKRRASLSWWSTTCYTRCVGAGLDKVQGLVYGVCMSKICVLRVCVFSSPPPPPPRTQTRTTLTPRCSSRSLRRGQRRPPRPPS